MCACVEKSNEGNEGPLVLVDLNKKLRNLDVLPPEKKSFWNFGKS